MMLEQAIVQLIEYGIKEGLIAEEDRTYATNRVLEVMKMDGLSDVMQSGTQQTLQEVLSVLLEEAQTRGLIEDSTLQQRDLFDTKLMGCLTPMPSKVREQFWSEYKKSPKQATDYFYHFSKATNYIRQDRIKKDVKWKVDTAYGKLDITINLAKPEKDPKEIAAAKNAPKTGYPKCLLCVENEGYAGHSGYPARQNHRIIPLGLAGQRWYLQYSPYIYFNEHCIVLNELHRPMKIDRGTFERLLSFIRQFPHYFIGSNADLPIVGGSILSHDHFQGGNYEFAMAGAPIKTPFCFRGYEQVQAGVLDWPLSTIRLRCETEQPLVELAWKLLLCWKGYTDESRFVFAQTNGVEHNTITPIARMRQGWYELDIVLRNNITTKEHPMGVFHPHAPLHHIKKENIGLIEVMGLAVLPARLKQELKQVEQALLTGETKGEEQRLGVHADWVRTLRAKYNGFECETVETIVRDEVGQVFLQVLEDCAVFKQTKEGNNALIRFLQSV